MALNWKGWELFSTNKKEDSLEMKKLKEVMKPNKSLAEIQLEDKITSMRQDAEREKLRQHLSNTANQMGQPIQHGSSTYYPKQSSTPNTSGYPSGMATNIPGSQGQWATSTPGSLNSMQPSLTQPLGQWNTSQVTSLGGMFSGAQNMPYNVNNLTTVEQAQVIVKMMMREGFSSIDPQVFYLVQKMYSDASMIKSPKVKKQPKKKLDL